MKYSNLEPAYVDQVSGDCRNGVWESDFTHPSLHACR